MNILDNSSKNLVPKLPQIIQSKLNKNVEKIKFIGGGSFGKVYKVTLSDGEQIAIKAFKVQGSQYTEGEQLEILGKHTSVNMPKVFFTFEDDETALLAMSFVEGTNTLNPVFLLKSKDQKAKYANDVVEGMLQWHSVCGEKFGELSNPKYDTWLEYYRQEKQEPWLKGLTELANSGNFSRKKLDFLVKATEIFNKLPEEETKPVLIHGDLNIMNIMADKKTMELTAFIDPRGTMWAAREYDLFQLRNMWGDAFGLYETYKKKHSLSEYSDFRVSYYGAIFEASMRLGVGYVFPLWEDLCFKNLKKELKKLSI